MMIEGGTTEKGIYLEIRSWEKTTPEKNLNSVNEGAILDGHSFRTFAHLFIEDMQGTEHE